MAAVDLRATRGAKNLQFLKCDVHDLRYTRTARKGEERKPQYIRTFLSSMRKKSNTFALLGPRHRESQGHPHILEQSGQTAKYIRTFSGVTRKPLETSMLFSKIEGCLQRFNENDLRLIS